MKIKVTQIRVGYFEPKPEYYEDKSADGIIATEKLIAAEGGEYMDMLDASEEFTFEVVADTEK